MVRFLVHVKGYVIRFGVWLIFSASIVILSPYLMKMEHKSFLIFSISRAVALMTPNPSSLYNPKLFPCFAVIRCSKYEPTSSHDSAPSKLPIVTSKRLDDVRLPQ